MHRNEKILWFYWSFHEFKFYYLCEKILIFKIKIWNLWALHILTKSIYYFLSNGSYWVCLRIAQWNYFIFLSITFYEMSYINNLIQVIFGENNIGHTKINRFILKSILLTNLLNDQLTMQLHSVCVFTLIFL